MANQIFVHAIGNGVEQTLQACGGRLEQTGEGYQVFFPQDTQYGYLDSEPGSLHPGRSHHWMLPNKGDILIYGENTMYGSKEGSQGDLVTPTLCIQETVTFRQKAKVGGYTTWYDRWFA